MRIRFEIEIPNWTRWIAAGLAVGIGLGYGLAVVHADPVSVKTWNSGDALTAAALNKNFTDLQNAINAQQVAISALSNPDCPPGYSRDANATTIFLCTKLSDQVVRVSNGNAAFWIDRYEASIWDGANGTGQQWGLVEAAPFPSNFPENGQYATPLFAMSMVGVKPSGYANWFQAQAACEAVGKRLPSGEEWLRAARGTFDIGGSNGHDGSCLTDGMDIRNTGEGRLCASKWGAEDMIGNMSERTSEWYAAPGPDTMGGPSNPWRAASYNSDITLGIASEGQDWGLWPGLPTSASRGGSLRDIDGAGIFALDLRYTPSFQHAQFGFRCVTPR